MNRIWLHLLLALLAGLGLGLAYSWLIAPSQFTEATPDMLSVNFKAQYREVVAAAYASNHDLERARSRLAELGDPDPMQALSAQAQQMLAAGESFDDVRDVAQLASDLQQGVVSLPLPNTSTPTEHIVTILPSTQTPMPNETPSGDVEATATEEIATPFVFTTSTPRPTHTSAPPPGRPFALVGQDIVCDTNLPEGLLQVTFMDARRRPVAGVEVEVTWNEGEDNFFTGFKPELGDGYADFQMEAGITYSVRVVQSGTTVPAINIPECTDPNGQTFPGGILLTFQRQ
ncbi:MAG: hypothetical protein AB1649_11250 [Chloroflexota bacterium]